MRIMDEDVPFQVTRAEEAGLSSDKLNEAYHELAETFPTLYSLLLVKDDRLVFEKYHGGAKTNHAYSIKSLTKSIMNALIGISIQRGWIRSIDQYVTDFAQDVPPEMLRNLEGVTLRHLLAMTHGIGIGENSPEMLEIWRSPNWVKSILDVPLARKPGQSFHYCTCTTHLLSAVLSVISGESAAQYASRELFRPIGIRSPVYWEHDPQGVNWGGTNMILTPRMLARFGQLYLADGVWQGQRLLPENWCSESASLQSEGWGDYAGYGLLWWVSSCEGISYSFASGYGGQYVYVIPSYRTTIVLTANSDIGIAEMQATTSVVVRDPGYLVRKFLLDCML